MTKTEKKPLIVIAGPTASGKSDTAAELGRLIGGEVVSADAMQVYKYMDIGSAKVTKEEMLGVPHHMIDVAEPTEAFDVTRYAAMAKACIEDIHRRGRIPILCGGTGFYIQAVVRDIDFEETTGDPLFRKKLMAEAEALGNEALHERLRAVDPVSAEAIHPNNIRRVIRALEYFEETGRTISSHNEEEAAKASPYDLFFYCLNDDREKLYERIDHRVDFMLDCGLVEEIKFLKSMGLTADMVSMQGIGYKEMLNYLDGLTSYEEAVRLVKRNSRHYAKRQVTWFKREREVRWLMVGDFDCQPLRIAEHIAGEIRPQSEET